MTWDLRQGHVIDVLRAMDADSVQCAVTSPPYWSLRAYGTEAQVWGGATECEHEWVESERLGISGGPNPKQDSNQGSRDPASLVAVCTQCGAWRGELGSEPTIALYIEHLMMVFDEVRRVLRPDGTCWVNLGDSYAGSGKGPSNSLQPAASQIGSVGQRIGSVNGESGHTSGVTPTDGLKPKNLCLIPERFAIAMQMSGWWVRSRIAWCKRSPMPGSQRDRDTTAWEPIYKFTKSRHAASYYDTVKTPPKSAHSSGNGYIRPERLSLDGRGQTEPWVPSDDGVMPRDHWWIPYDADDEAWLLSSEPRPGGTTKHFATFPREIPRRCILRSCPVDGTVLDPFVGSGTTLFVAEELGRDSIGIELSVPYVRLAEKRMRGARTPLPGMAP